MKNIAYILLIITSLLLPACKKTVFERSQQNPAAFQKTISIKDAVALLDGDRATFPEGFKIEGVVVASGGDHFFMQDEDGRPGLAIAYPTGDSIHAGQRVTVSAGGQEMVKAQSVYRLEGIQQVEIEMEGQSRATNLSVADIENDLSQYSSTLVSLSNVKLSDSTHENGGITYSITDPTGTLKTFIPDGADYSLPDSAEKITGVVEITGGEVYLNTRSEDDVLEVVPPPTLFELIRDNSGLVMEYIDTQRTALSDGIMMYQGRYRRKEDSKICTFTLFSVDLKVEGNGLTVGMTDDGTNLVARTSLVDMAKVKDDHIRSEGLQVVAAVNGDQFVTAPVSPQKTYEPFGPVIKDGVELKSTFYAASRDGFLAIRKDGSCLIGHTAAYEAERSSFQEAIGGEIILEDSEIVPTGGTGKVPRSSIGYTADQVVYVFQGDGVLSHGAADDGWSAGFSNEDMSILLQSVGVVNAVYLSAGDYSMAAARLSSGQEIHNVSRPSWVGHGDAWMSNSWLIVAKQP